MVKKFLTLNNGIPSHDTLERVFENIDSEEFEGCFIAWTRSISEKCGAIIAIDGKTLRRSYDNFMDQSPIHILNAWRDDNRLVLGQMKVDGKSNEITAIPKMFLRNYVA